MDDLMAAAKKSRDEDIARERAKNPQWASSNLNEISLSEKFVADCKDDIHFCYQSKKWYVYDGQKWRVDTSGTLELMIIDCVKSLYSNAALIDGSDARKNYLRKVESLNTRAGASNVLYLARARCPLDETELDADPHLFNCRNGTLNLQTYELMPHKREDMLSKLANVDYNPEAQCPQWDAHLNLIFNNNQELIKDFQKIAGYCLLSGNPDAKIFILCGRGRNGKSATLAVFQYIFGTYSCSIAPESLMHKRGETVRTDLLHMLGARMIISVEPEQHSRLNASLIKSATGGDTLTARHLYGEEVDFKLIGKILLATNYKPEIHDQSTAMWERVVLIPFEVYIPPDQQDSDIVAKLITESAGILNWCVEGLKKYRADGRLILSQKITDTTEEYKESEDWFYEFLHDKCEQIKDKIKDDDKVSAKTLYNEYKNWCALNQAHLVSQTKFGREMGNRYNKTRCHDGYYYQGIKLKAQTAIT
jgi:putative DNA primase/helicase